MKQETVIRLLALLILVAIGAWVVVYTEWVDEERPRPLQGEARENPVYATEQLLRRLGMTVAHHQALPSMPPAGARLVLLSQDWQLFPERTAELRQWVEAGGHLVLPRDASWYETRFDDWVPVETRFAKMADPPASAAPAQGFQPSPHFNEVGLRSTPPLWGSQQKLTVCKVLLMHQKLQPKRGHTATWSLAREDIAQALRVPVGRGSVTVLNASNNLFFTDAALRCDNGQLIAAALQAEPGATAWIYLNEKRQALLPWLWQQGWIAIVAGLLALAALLWRRAVRFGPRLAAPPRLRRSITEQVRGLGAYLHREGREALLSAQQRALQEAAARHLPGYARLAAGERARAIAAATQTDEDALRSALSARTVTRAQLPPYLQLLETARRSLAHRTHEERRATP